MAALCSTVAYVALSGVRTIAGLTVLTNPDSDGKVGNIVYEVILLLPPLHHPTDFNGVIQP